MTQAQLAGDDFTKGFISLLETGRTHASLRAAGILARRLDVPIGDLMVTHARPPEAELEFTLIRAEQELAAGRAQVAAEAAAALQPKTSGLLRARAKRLRARALIESTRSREAIQLLDEARREFIARGERELAARTLFDLARAHARLDQPGEALHYLLLAERALEAREVVDATLDLQVQRLLANTYVRLGDYDAASLRGERALALAQDIADPHALANLYSGMARTRYEQGDLEAAIAYARRALDIYRRDEQATAVAEMWNTLGWLYVKRGHHGKAAEALDRSERLAQETGNDRLAAWILSTRAELALGRSRLDEAKDLAQRAADAPSATPRLRALSKLIYAQAVAASKASLREVRRAYDEAISAHRGEPRSARARAHEDYARALAERDATKAALAQAQRALELMKPVLP